MPKFEPLTFSTINFNRPSIPLLPNHQPNCKGAYPDFYHPLLIHDFEKPKTFPAFSIMRHKYNTGSIKESKQMAFTLSLIFSTSLKPCLSLALLQFELSSNKLFSIQARLAWVIYTSLSISSSLKTYKIKSC